MQITAVARPRTHQSFSAHHDKNDNNDKISINLCQSLSWATFQIPCHSCHLCHSAKVNKYIYPLVMNTGSDSTGKWACQWPIGLTQTTTDSGYQCLKPICVTACAYIRRHRGWPMPRPMKLSRRYILVWHSLGRSLGRSLMHLDGASAQWDSRHSFNQGCQLVHM